MRSPQNDPARDDSARPWTITSHRQEGRFSVASTTYGCHHLEMNAEERPITDADLAELVQRMDEAAGAFIKGDIDHYLSLFDHADDYSLMGPTGGETVHGFDSSGDRLAEFRSFFTSGEARLEVDQTYVSGDLAVLVAVERQHGEVGGSPDQDWSLRVTLVLRRVGDRWHLVHRHADALVHPIPWSHLAELARGLVA
jgi:ketosteroid isomerase-like protein